MGHQKRPIATCINDMNQSNSAKKKTSLQIIIGWLALILGAWLMIGSVVAMIGFTMNGAPPMDLQTEMRDRFWVFAYLARHYLIAASIQFLLAICIIVSGVGYLRLKSWARWLLSGTSMLIVVFLFVVALQFVVGPKDSVALFGLAATLISAMPFSLVIYILRKNAIREEQRAA